MNAPMKQAVVPESEKVNQLIHDFEEELAALKGRFDMFFLGVERQNPSKDLDKFRKELHKLKGQYHRNTAVKFRLSSLDNKFLSYDRLWQKTLKEIEEGTYRRDLQKLKRKLDQKKDEKKPEKAADAEPQKKEEPKQKGVFSLDDLEADLPDELFGDSKPAAAAPPPPPAAARPPPPPAAAASPGAAKPPPPPAAAAAKPPPAPAAAVSRPPPPPSAAAKPPPAPPAAAKPPPPPAAARPPTAPKPVSGAELSDEKVSQIYQAYITAKKRCKESTEGITQESLASSLRKQVPKLMEQNGVKSVEFKVVIKDGKAVLKAVPK